MRGAWLDMGLVKLASTVLNNDLSRLIIALVLIGGTVGLLFLGRDVPMALWTMDGLAAGFFFGVAVGKTP